MRRTERFLPLALLLITLAAPSIHAAANATLVEQVRAAEVAFAKTMADRDHAAFSTFLAEEAIFFGSRAVQRGKVEVAAAWKPLFEGSQAPFSWTPTTVEVLASGTLALTSGPVLDPSGKQVAVFNSIWRREKDGRWRVLFDKGCDWCAPAAAGSPLERLGWLAGCWQRLNGEQRSDEQWMPPAGGMMLGMGRTVRGDKTREFEQMQIVQQGDQLIFTSKPSGQPEASFNSIELTATRVVFENKEHDFPQRVIYALQPDGSLAARIEGAIAGKEQAIDFPLQRVACALGSGP